MVGLGRLRPGVDRESASALAPITLAGRRSLSDVPRRASQRVIAGGTRTGAVLVVR
jgi:hypothetical protein